MVEELKRTGRVVRRKTEGATTKLEEVTADARTTAAIKGKLALDSELSALDISVDTTDGLVTLAGRVDSPEDMARALELALEQDGVREVVSTLQIVKHDKP
jgi:hyperosmotically inducible protein